MIYCRQCLHELPDGTVFCDICGTSLLPDVMRGSLASAGAPPAQPVLPAPEAPLGPAAPLWPAPRRSRKAARPRDMPPLVEGAELTPATPPQIMPLPFKAKQAESPVSFEDMEGTPQRVRLRLTNGKTFELRGKAEYLIGRRDPGSDAVPDVDLADWNGAASGVSREHAAIYVGPDGVFIEDRESLNETIRNEFRLLPRQLYPLKDGDEVRLGTLMLLVVIS